jgi:hypothetical protein
MVVANILMKIDPFIDWLIPADLLRHGRLSGPRQNREVTAR